MIKISLESPYEKNWIKGGIGQGGDSFDNKMKTTGEKAWQAAWQLVRFNFLIAKKRNAKVFVFELASLGELQFFQNILMTMVEKFPNAIIAISHRETTPEEFYRLLPELAGRIHHISRSVLDSGMAGKIDLFFTTEQYHLGLDGAYSICLFHGQPSKGLTFTRQILSSFDAFFMYGPLHRLALEDFLKRNEMEQPPHLEIFDIGYSKSDDLLQNKFDRLAVLKELGLSARKKTILYAPAFNEGASLQTVGMEIIAALVRLRECNVIVKLPIDCYDSAQEFQKSGGTNWPEKLKNFEKSTSHFRLYEQYVIDPVLECADVLITCVSSVSFEFMALKKPVIFIDTPEFFNSYLKKRFPHDDTPQWANNPFVNAGRKYGWVIHQVSELPAAIKKCLTGPHDSETQALLGTLLLFNPGAATAAAVKKITELAVREVRSGRPFKKASPFSRLLRRMWRHLKFHLKRSWQNFVFQRGYKIAKLGTGYIDIEKLAKLAKKNKVSLCDYLEGQEDHPRKKGHRDRIIRQLQTLGVFSGCERICEIGVGTGRFMEKAIELAAPGIYEIYETERTIINYLKRNYSQVKKTRMVFHACDGKTLRQTPSRSCDLVHAHALFVCLPVLQVLEYVQECVRVCKPGGHIVFDCFMDDSFDLDTAEAWLCTPYRFPTIVPRKMLAKFARIHSLILLKEFSEIYGASHSDYFVYKKSETGEPTMNSGGHS